ncbi:MAG: alkaline phosphatase D family protein [Asticcacaulis sp.]
MSRRELMAGLGGFGLIGFGTLFSAHPVWANPVFKDYPFQLGIAAGDPAPDGFVIWTRLAPEPMVPEYGMPKKVVNVDWEVAEDRGFDKIVAKGTAPARPELGHAVHVEVTGLQPARPYFYRFTAGSERSAWGQARTTPLAGADVKGVRFGIVGCQRYEDGYYNAHRHLSREDLDFVFCYGDYIYEYRGDRIRGVNERVRYPEGDEIYSLDDYRRRYSQYKMDADLQAAHAAAAWFTVWDDHEIDNNWVQDIDQDGVDPMYFRLRQQMAMQAYYEHMPLRLRSFPRGNAMQLYRRATYGQLLEMNFLDTRQYRTDQPCGDKWAPACKDVYSANAEVLGLKQEAWLLEGLRGSKARWNTMAQQVMLMDLHRSYGEDYTVNPDSWAGYRTPRNRLLKALRDQKISNPVFLTGDEHQNFAGELHLDGRKPEKAAIATEFVCTSISSGGDGEEISTGGKMMMARNTDQLKFMNSQRGYMLCEVAPDAWTTHVKVVDQISTKGGKLSTRAKLTVPHGEAKMLVG